MSGLYNTPSVRLFIFDKRYSMNKRILLLIFLTSIFSPGFSQGATQSRATVDQLTWLVGTWKRTNSKAGQSGFETWSKVSSTELRGRGITMRGSDTVFVEKIRIISKDKELYYVADVPENKEPVYFRIIELKEGGFTCENPEHDFPKKISYSRQGNKLHATISGNGKAITYLFEKTSN